MLFCEETQWCGAGLLPSNSTVGFLVSRAGSQPEEKEAAEEAPSSEEDKTSCEMRSIHGFF